MTAELEELGKSIFVNEAQNKDTNDTADTWSELHRPNSIWALSIFKPGTDQPGPWDVART